jgi:quinol monooxygenase YgiN
MTTSSSSIIVLVEFETRCSRNEWLETFAPRATDARNYEPNTVSYSAWANSEKSKYVFFYEKYNSIKDIGTHLHRKAHDELVERLGKKQMTKRMILPAVKIKPLLQLGWSQRSGKPITSGSIFNITTLRFSKQTDLKAYLKLMEKHVVYCNTNEPELLMYSGGIVQEDVKKGDYAGMIQNGDLLWFSIYASDNAAKIHLQGNMEHLIPTIKKNGIQFIQPFHKTYYSTGLGYMSRDEKVISKM